MKKNHNQQELDELKNLYKISDEIEEILKMIFTN